MIDLEVMIKSSWLAWLKRIFSENDSTWKNYLQHILESFGGLFLFHCNHKLIKLMLFFKSEPETLLHLLFNCLYSKLFWKDFEFFFYSLSKEFVHLSPRGVLIGIISSECPLLNYFLLIAKLHLWDCRRFQILPSLAGFKMKIKINLKWKNTFALHVSTKL